MLEHGKMKILPVIPQLIIPIKSELTITAYRRYSVRTKHCGHFNT